MPYSPADDALTAIQWIVKHCSDRLLPHAQAALRAGETLTFGHVRIDREGIAFGSDALFKRVPVLSWRTIRLDRIPHPTLFARLFRELAPRVEIDDPRSSSKN